METFETYRPLMFSIAYRMLGSAMEAEDIVQEAYLRYQATPPETIRSPQAFLSTIVTRLCLNPLQSARSQRETYIGPWLPEPVLTGADAALVSPAGQVSAYESISMAFLVLLEQLTPLERAVFLLREVFDYEYAEIAEIVGREEAACRQLFSRAKKHLVDNRPRFKSSPETHRQILERFMQAVGVGDLEGLTSLLAEDVTLWSDGGGKVTAARKPVHGRELVARFFLNLRKFEPAEGIDVDVSEVNGATSVIFRSKAGKPLFVFSLQTGNGLIHAFWAVGNPDKLKHV
ncbi:MAG: RNA polymerase sigma-70 factor [Anaerolineae bacterium]|nr:RNA polymerase sigma-70 factor [Anaerolineae bacterium]